MGILAMVRLVVCLMLGACGFQHGLGANSDGGIDGAADARPDGTPKSWTIDPASGKSCPATDTEWSNFIGAGGLAISTPNALWPMQETSGSLADAIGPIALAPQGTSITSGSYRQPVAGWTRGAIKISDGSNAVFFNSQNLAMPDLSTTSMTILLFYATASVPTATRSVLFGGCCSGGSTLAQVGIDTASHLVLTVGGGTPVVGTMTSGASVVPLLLKLDVSHTEQKLITNNEVITAVYKTLGASRGIILGGALNPPPDGRFLYMAAWYGARAEISDLDAQSLITALGWP